MFLSAGAKAYFGFFSIAFVIYSVIKNYEKINQIPFTNDLGFYFSVGYILSILSLIVNAFAWKLLIKWLGYKQNSINIIYLYLRTNLLKYLPGGIWHFFERYRALTNSIAPSKAFYSVLLEPFLMLSAALFLVPMAGFKNIAYILFFLPSILLARRWRGSLLMQLGGMKLLQFRKLGARVEFAEDSFVEDIPCSPYPFYPFLIEMLFIILRFYSFWFCLKAFSIENAFNLSSWISLFSLSWSIGLVVPSAPGGIGIFESSVILASRGIPEESILLALISYRFIVSLADLSLPLLLLIRNKLPPKSYSI